MQTKAALQQSCLVCQRRGEMPDFMHDEVTTICLVGSGNSKYKLTAPQAAAITHWQPHESAKTNQPASQQQPLLSYHSYRSYLGLRPFPYDQFLNETQTMQTHLNGK